MTKGGFGEHLGDGFWRVVDGLVEGEVGEDAVPGGFPSPQRSVLVHVVFPSEPVLFIPLLVVCTILSKQSMSFVAVSPSFGRRRRHSFLVLLARRVLFVVLEISVLVQGSVVFIVLVFFLVLVTVQVSVEIVVFLVLLLLIVVVLHLTIWTRSLSHGGRSRTDGRDGEGEVGRLLLREREGRR